MMMNQSMQSPCDSFDRDANDPYAWKKTAEGLVSAALILRQNRPEPERFPDPGFSRTLAFTQLLWPELMLWGMSIEDLLKCRFLTQGGILARNGKLVVSKRHDLSEWAKKASFSIGGEEERIMSMLSRAVTWVGRYPVAVEFIKTGGWRFWASPPDDEIVDLIIGRLRRDIGDLKPNSACS